MVRMGGYGYPSDAKFYLSYAEREQAPNIFCEGLKLAPALQGQSINQPCTSLLANRLSEPNVIHHLSNWECNLSARIRDNWFTMCKSKQETMIYVMPITVLPRLFEE